LEGVSAERDGQRSHDSAGASSSQEEYLGEFPARDGERSHDSAGASCSREADDDSPRGEADAHGPSGERGQNLANEPKPGDAAVGQQFLSSVEVAANSGVAPALDNGGFVVKSEDGEQREVEPEVCEPRSIERGDANEPPASRPDEEIGRAGVGAAGPVPDTAPGKPNGDRTLARGAPAVKNDRTKSERRRRRREKERIERMRIEQKIDEKLRSGKVTSASKLIEEVLWPSSKGVESDG
jgi:hypothetical protein